MSWTEVVTHLLVATVGGGAIGLERQCRGRSAGIRTNALVALGSALFVILGADPLTAGRGDPSRVAAQIVSGIGFLGAGVIMKQGPSVSGLNTAATLWAAAAVGALAGSGSTGIATLGTGAVLGANTVLRAAGHVLDRRLGLQSEDGVQEYLVTVHSMPTHDLDVRAALLAAAHRPEVHLTSMASTREADETVITAAVATDAGAQHVEELVSDLARFPGIRHVEWRRREEQPRPTARRSGEARSGRHRSGTAPAAPSPTGPVRRPHPDHEPGADVRDQRRPVPVRPGGEPALTRRHVRRSRLVSR